MTAATGGADVTALAGWRLCATPPGAIASPEALATLPPNAWVDAGPAMTVGAALRQAGRWSLDAPERRFDADDWWYETTFDAAPPADGEALERVDQPARDPGRRPLIGARGIEEAVRC